jgi:hypothetical protein
VVEAKAGKEVTVERSGDRDVRGGEEAAPRAVVAGAVGWVVAAKVEGWAAVMEVVVMGEGVTEVDETGEEGMEAVELVRSEERRVGKETVVEAKVVEGMAEGEKVE